MFAWASSLVSGTNPEFPYKPQPDTPEHACAGWVLRQGTDANTNTAVTIHSFSLTEGASDEVVAGARRSVKQLKLMRHPNILKFLGSVESATEITMATEPVQPLSVVLDDSESELVDTVAHPEAAVWGLYQIANALAFVHQAKLVLGNFNPASVMVTKGGDWKLTGFEIALDAASLAQGTVPDTRCLSAWFPKSFTPPETTTGPSYSAHAWDMWGVGCLVYQLWTNDPKPQALKAAWSKLVSKTPASRLTPQKLMSHPAFKGKYTQTLLFLEGLALKSDQEKVAFYTKLPSLINVQSMANHVGRYKVLPIMLEAVQAVNSTTTVDALPPLLAIARSLPPAEFQSIVQPTLVRLFSSPERNLRASLLQHMSSIVEHLEPSILIENIYPQVVQGFGDSAPQLRDLTVVCMHHMAPRMAIEEGLLSEAKSDEIAKLLMRSMVDKEPVIRTNSVVCIGKVAKYLTPKVRNRVLCPSIMKAAKDPFGKAREATCLTLSSCYTAGLFDKQALATQVVPLLGNLAIDQLNPVRNYAIGLLRKVCDSLQSESEATDEAQKLAAQNASPGEQAAAQAEETAGGSDWSSWAIKGLSAGAAAASTSIAQAALKGIAKKPADAGAPAPAAPAASVNAAPVTPATKFNASISSAQGKPAAAQPQKPPSTVAAPVAAPLADDNEDDGWGNDELDLDDDPPPVVQKQPPAMANTSADTDGWGDEDESGWGDEGADVLEEIAPPVVEKPKPIPAKPRPSPAVQKPPMQKKPAPVKKPPVVQKPPAARPPVAKAAKPAVQSPPKPKKPTVTETQWDENDNWGDDGW